MKESLCDCAEWLYDSRNTDFNRIDFLVQQVHKASGGGGCIITEKDQTEPIYSLYDINSILEEVEGT